MLSKILAFPFPQFQPKAQLKYVLSFIYTSLNKLYVLKATRAGHLVMK